MQIDLHKFGQLKYFSTTIFVSQFFVFTMITKTRQWRHIYHDIGIPKPKNHDIKIPRPKNHDIEIPRPKTHDIEIPRPKNHDIEIPRPKNHDIEKRRQISHDIVIPRRFFRGQKATTSRFQDQKATTLSSCGILTLMSPDRILAEQSEYHGIVEHDKSSGTT